MAFINRIPKGLLGLLDLKTQGENPSQLQPYVQGTLELRDLYTINTRASDSQASTLTALGFTVGAFANLVVPQGELWLLYNLTAHLSTPPLGAGATLTGAVGFVPSDNQRFLSLSQAQSPAIATGADFIAAWTGALILQPGDQPQVYLTTLTGGNVGVRLNLLRSRFLI